MLTLNPEKRISCADALRHVKRRNMVALPKWDSERERSGSGGGHAESYGLFLSLTGQSDGGDFKSIDNNKLFVEGA